MNPVFLAASAVITCLKLSRDGEVVSRKIPMNEFFLGYRKTALEHTEIIASICKTQRHNILPKIP